MGRTLRKILMTIKNKVSGLVYPPPAGLEKEGAPSEPPRPSCIYCGKPADHKYRLKDGTIRYDKSCTRCKRRPYMRYRKRYCELCGFIPWTMAQLEVHHIDEDRTNNNRENLVTLCANCHRYVHWPDMTQ